MRYLIDGCYGDGNVGDDALLYALRQMLATNDPQADIRVMSTKPEETSKLHNVPSILQANPFTLNVYGAILKGQLFPILKAIRWCDYFIVGGGELFRDDVGLQATLGMFYRMFLAHANRKRVLALGIGAQASQTRAGRWILRNALGIADAVLFRERESLSVARSLCPDGSFSCSPDLVFSFAGTGYQKPIIPSNASNSAFRLGICFKGGVLSESEGRRILSLLVHMVKAVSMRGNFLTTALAFGHADRNAAVKLSAQLSSAGIKVNLDISCDIQRLRTEIATLDCMVSMPLHGCIFSFASAVPTLGVAYDFKLTKLFRSFGLQEYCLESSTLTFENLMSTFGNLRRNLEGIQGQLRNQVLRAREDVIVAVKNIFRPTLDPVCCKKARNHIETTNAFSA
jgi:polysaccharide pyruvyl transferase WcaK-like protein